jgi:hypothetical protein
VHNFKNREKARNISFFPVEEALRPPAGKAAPL